MEDQKIDVRIAKLQRSHRRLLVLTVALTVAAVALYLRPIGSVSASTAPDVLRVRELVVVDQNGMERVIIGAPLPGQWENGRANTKRLPRPNKQSGILIFDKDGVERGGYVTEDAGNNALLTLDDKRRQEVLLVTGPEPTSSFRMWTGSDSLELRVDPDRNGPSFRMVRGGKTLFEQPQEPTPLK